MSPRRERWWRIAEAAGKVLVAWEREGVTYVGIRKDGTLYTCDAAFIPRGAIDTYVPLAYALPWLIASMREGYSYGKAAADWAHELAGSGEGPWPHQTPPECCPDCTIRDDEGYVDWEEFDVETLTQEGTCRKCGGSWRDEFALARRLPIRPIRGG